MADTSKPGTGKPAGAKEPPAPKPSKEKDEPKLPTTQADLEAQIASGDLKFLSKEEIKEADDTIYEIVAVPEWGGAVKVRSFSKGMQIEIDERATVAEEIVPQKVQMFAFLEGVVTPEFDLDDQTWLHEKSAAAFDRVVTRIFELSAIGREAAEDAEARFRDGAG
jgi:hypothetical protein